LLARQGASEGDAMRLSRRDVQSREVRIIPVNRVNIKDVYSRKLGVILVTGSTDGSFPRNRVNRWVIPVTGSTAGSFRNRVNRWAILLIG
jgi:hypothetical protein